MVRKKIEDLGRLFQEELHQQKMRDIGEEI